MDEVGARDRPVVYCHTGFTEVHNLGSLGHWYVELPETPRLY
jgi:hypothetical protein